MTEPLEIETANKEKLAIIHVHQLIECILDPFTLSSSCIQNLLSTSTISNSIHLVLNELTPVHLRGLASNVAAIETEFLDSRWDASRRNDFCSQLLKAIHRTQRTVLVENSEYKIVREERRITYDYSSQGHVERELLIEISENSKICIADHILIRLDQFHPNLEVYDQYENKLQLITKTSMKDRFNIQPEVKVDNDIVHLNSIIVPIPNAPLHKGDQFTIKLKYAGTKEEFFPWQAHKIKHVSEKPLIWKLVWEWMRFHSFIVWNYLRALIVKQQLPFLITRRKYVFHQFREIQGTSYLSMRVPNDFQIKSVRQKESVNFINGKEKFVEPKIRNMPDKGLFIEKNELYLRLPKHSSDHPRMLIISYGLSDVREHMFNLLMYLLVLFPVLILSSNFLDGLTAVTEYRVMTITLVFTFIAAIFRLAPRNDLVRTQRFFFLLRFAVIIAVIWAIEPSWATIDAIFEFVKNIVLGALESLRDVIASVIQALFETS